MPEADKDKCELRTESEGQRDVAVLCRCGRGADRIPLPTRYLTTLRLPAFAATISAVTPSCVSPVAPPIYIYIYTCLGLATRERREERGEREREEWFT